MRPKLQFGLRSLLIVTTACCIALGLYAAGWLANVLLLLFGFGCWYVLYGLECYMNGAIQGGNWMPFIQCYREFCWCLPWVGKKFRLADTLGDEEWAAMLPGRFHFMTMCVGLPLSPLIFYHLVI